MSDEQAIKQTIQTYFDCMYESSAEKTHAAFHPNAKITGVINGELQEMSVQDFAGFVASQQPSPKDKGEAARLDIVSLDVAGDTAVARCARRLPGDDLSRHPFVPQEQAINGRSTTSSSTSKDRRADTSRPSHGLLLQPEASHSNVSSRM